MAVWKNEVKVLCPLVVLILGHWSLLLHGVLISATWIDGQGCVITSTDNTLLATSFVYTMALDLIVLCLTSWKLGMPRERSMLAKTVFSDGVVYFIVAYAKYCVLSPLRQCNDDASFLLNSFLANMIATAFMLLDLNAVMSIIANVPAAVISTVCFILFHVNHTHRSD